MELEQVTRATDPSGERMLQMKWENSDATDLVPAKEATVKHPQIVIYFYEKKLTWHHPQRMMTKTTRIKHLSHLTVGFKWGKGGILLVLTP